MLAVGSMLEALMRDEAVEDYKNSNDDHDFSKVLEFGSDGDMCEHPIICSDGQMRSFVFED